MNWYTQFETRTPSPGSNKNKRYGIPTLDKPIDITGMSYLSFDVYVDSRKGDAALSNMYLELRDNEKEKKGCLGKTFIGGKDLYGQVRNAQQPVDHRSLSLGDVKAEKDFDEKHAKELRFGCNYRAAFICATSCSRQSGAPDSHRLYHQAAGHCGLRLSPRGRADARRECAVPPGCRKGTMVVDKTAVLS